MATIGGAVGLEGGARGVGVALGEAVENLPVERLTDVAK